MDQLHSTTFVAVGHVNVSTRTARALLLRRICCAEQAAGQFATLDNQLVQRLAQMPILDHQLRPFVGCEQCRQTGYKGRIGIFEIFEIDDEVRHMVNARAATMVLRQRARQLGMRTLREDGVRKVLAGLTSAEEVISITIGDAN